MNTTFEQFKQKRIELLAGLPREAQKTIYNYALNCGCSKKFDNEPDLLTADLDKILAVIASVVKAMKHAPENLALRYHEAVTASQSLLSIYQHPTKKITDYDLDALRNVIENSKPML